MIDCDKLKPWTKERVINILKLQGYFDVSMKWRYRDLQRIANIMVKERIIKRSRRVGDFIRFMRIEND